MRRSVAILAVFVLVIVAASTVAAVSVPDRSTPALPPASATDATLAASYDANGNRIIDKDEAIQAVIDYFNGRITKDQAIAVILFYFSGERLNEPPATAPQPQSQHSGLFEPIYGPMAGHVHHDVRIPTPVYGSANSLPRPQVRTMVPVQDVVAQAWFRNPLQPNPLGYQIRYGFRLRFNEQGPYMFFSVADTGAWWMHRPPGQGSSLITLGMDSSFDRRMGAYNHIAAGMVGNDGFLAINGRVMAIIQDTSVRSAGGVELVAHVGSGKSQGTMTHFEDFTVLRVNRGAHNAFHITDAWKREWFTPRFQPAPSTPTPTPTPTPQTSGYRGVTIASENRCSTYDRSDYSYSQSLEAQIVAGMGGRIYGPYTGRTFNSTRETDIEHIIALSEAHDSGMCRAGSTQQSAFASDLLNLTLASPEVNRTQKHANDAAEWLPSMNRCWYVKRIIDVRQKWQLTIDQREADAIEGVWSRCTSWDMVFVNP